MLSVLLFIGIVLIIITIPALAEMIDNKDLFIIQKNINDELDKLNLAGRLIPIVVVSILLLPITIIGIGLFVLIGGWSRFVKIYCFVFKKRK